MVFKAKVEASDSQVWVAQKVQNPQVNGSNNHFYLCASACVKLEACIDDEREFKTAKRPHAPGDATVWKRFFRDNFVIFVVDRKEQHFWNQ